MRTFVWMTVLGLVLGGAVWAMAQQQAQMGASQSPQGAGGAGSNYSSLCVGCHGATGKGNGPAAAALNPKPKDFTDCKLMTQISDDTLFKTIKGGGQSVGLSPTMPPWGGAITEPQIHELVKYIRGFCKK